jgi:hypothetical protein
MEKQQEKKEQWRWQLDIAERDEVIGTAIWTNS